MSVSPQIDSKVEYKPDVSMVQVLQREIQKFSTKYNVKSLLEQETMESLQKIVNIAMSTITTLEKENKELKEILSKKE